MGARGHILLLCLTPSVTLEESLSLSLSLASGSLFLMHLNEGAACCVLQRETTLEGARSP